MNSRQPGPAPVIGRVGVSFTAEDLVLVSGASTQAASSQGPTSRFFAAKDGEALYSQQKQD